MSLFHPATDLSGIVESSPSSRIIPVADALYIENELSIVVGRLIARDPDSDLADVLCGYINDISFALYDLEKRAAAVAEDGP